MNAANPIESAIKNSGGDDSTVFVFPSDIAAALWLEKALSITERDTLPSRRFIAWDTFKEQAVQATVSGKQSVTAVLRKMYALELTRRNAETKPLLLMSLIPETHAEDGQIFASWIARILPQLESWSKKTGRSHGNAADNEDNDLAFLKADYGDFLERNLLFEPSWQQPPLTDSGFTYIIFFPEAIEDWNEYEILLKDSPFVKTVGVPAIPEGEKPIVTKCATVREELKHVALSIEELLRSGISSEDIAISVPNLEDIAPYLLREFDLRGIPYEFRSGSPLGTLPAGRLFTLIQNCASTNFSFASLKALLLDRLIPWKERDIAEALIRFGIRNHCVTSWKEDGVTLDIWEEAFNAPTYGEAGDRELKTWYRELKKALTRMAEATNFTGVRDGYFAFRGRFIDSALYSDIDDAVVARCIEELNGLAGLEKMYAALVPPRAYPFFISILAEKKYVSQRPRRGVSVYPYRVAAGTPYAFHFILDASQDEATVLYRRLSFLRQDKREQLGISEQDASAAFFSIYLASPMKNTRTYCGARFSFSERALSGYRTPHGYFGEEGSKPPVLSDPLVQEFSLQESVIPKRAMPKNSAPKTAEPQRKYRSQQDGYASWKRFNQPKGFSYLRKAFADSLPALSALVEKIQMNGADIRVSATDLNVFSLCNAKWFLGKILGIEAIVSDAELLNERNLGLLYHGILKKLYEKIREADGAFIPERIETYRVWATELAHTGTAEYAEFRGPMAAPLIGAFAKKITDGIAGILERDAELLDHFVPEFLEQDLAVSRGGIRYYGKIDRVSKRTSDGTAVLIDYKSGKVPSPSAYIAAEGQAIEDCQIPMYVFLAEEAEDSPYRGTRIEHAWFGDIKNADYRPILNDGDALSCGAKKGMVTRDEFGAAMESFQDTAAFFAEAVRNCDFTRPADLPWSVCAECDFQKICRITYAVGHQ